MRCWLVCTVVVRLTGVRFPARPILLLFFCLVLAPKHTARTCGSVSKNISRLYSLAVEHSLSKREVTGSSPVGGYEIEKIFFCFWSREQWGLGPEESFESSILCFHSRFQTSSTAPSGWQCCCLIFGWNDVQFRQKEAGKNKKKFCCLVSIGIEPMTVGLLDQRSTN